VKRQTGNDRGQGAEVRRRRSEVGGRKGVMESGGRKRGSRLYPTNSKSETRNPKHETRHLLLVTRHLLLVTRHSSLVTCYSSLVTRHASLVTAFQQPQPIRNHHQRCALVGADRHPQCSKSRYRKSEKDDFNSDREDNILLNDMDRSFTQPF
jgi:hypothetical protein